MTSLSSCWFYARPHASGRIYGCKSRVRLLLQWGHSGLDWSEMQGVRAGENRAMTCLQRAGPSDIREANLPRAIPTFTKEHRPQGPAIEADQQEIAVSGPESSVGKSRQAVAVDAFQGQRRKADSALISFAPGESANHIAGWVWGQQVRCPPQEAYTSPSCSGLPRSGGAQPMNLIRARRYLADGFSRLFSQRLIRQADVFRMAAVRSCDSPRSRRRFLTRSPRVCGADG
jgi:hypothetical protein